MATANYRNPADNSPMMNNTYNTFSKDKNITNHYLITTLLWQLTGPINDIYNNNIRTTPGIKDTNLRSIQDAEKTFPNLS